jgi:hypothetical protein
MDEKEEASNDIKFPGDSMKKVLQRLYRMAGNLFCGIAVQISQLAGIRGLGSQRMGLLDDKISRKRLSDC